MQDPNIHFAGDMQTHGSIEDATLSGLSVSQMDVALRFDKKLNFSRPFVYCLGGSASHALCHVIGCRPGN